MTPSLEKLWKLTGEDFSSATSEWNMAMDSIGLNLVASPGDVRYWCTPKNTSTFAVTGGDGTHYGLLATDGVVGEESPVVMTTPMSDVQNIVVGESLKDFLGLGCRTGYFVLEQLAYDSDGFTAELERQAYDPESAEGEIRWLRRIQLEFGVEPWSNPRARLDRLRKKYGGMLVVEAEGDA